MVFDWEMVKVKYGNGYQVLIIWGGKFVNIICVDDVVIYIESLIWSVIL